MSKNNDRAESQKSSDAIAMLKSDHENVKELFTQFEEAESQDAKDNIDTMLQIAGPDAMKYARALARDEGIFVGISSGATLAGAIRIAQDAPKNSNILAMLPDTGERYLSTPLFENIGVDMNEEEQALSKSTPGYQFG